MRLKKFFLRGFMKFLTDFYDHIEYVKHIFNLFLANPDDKTIKVKSITD